MLTMDAHGRFALLAYGGLAGAIVVGWATVAALRRADELAPAAVAKPKVFRRVLAEDMRVSRRGVLGIDFVKCGRCMLEKRKRGALTLGGMNVLVIEDLEIVVPPEGDAREGIGKEDRDSREARSGRHESEDAKAVVRRMGISENFLMARGFPFKFSGVRISNLSVGRLAGSNTVERVFSARAAEAGRGGLELSGCRICRGEGAEEDVHGAKLRLVGRSLRLEWNGGSLDVLGPDAGSNAEK